VDNIQLATTLLEVLLSKLQIESTILYDADSKSFNIDSPDHALLIGKKGENLRALQHILNILLKRQDPTIDWYIVDVAGYKKERLQKLQSIAESVAQEVIESGKSKHLPAMNSFERMQIHTFLANNKAIFTESEGQEPNRSIVIKKR
jgi:spoIIIJ-associated protein